MTRSDTDESEAPARGRDAATLTGAPGPADTADLEGDSATAIPPSLHARFAEFHRLGQGGMGVVYRAWDRRLGRRVAIKLVSAGAQVDGRFLREARSQARLRHEHVCEVYEAGVAEGVPFIVMRHIDGPSLQEARGDLTSEEKVRVLRAIAAALHEAHRLGLVHRDVKPSNIMLERGEDGAWHPYLMDFGIAREVGESGPTLTGAPLGTPAFMAPEQAAGQARALDRRTDVYGLGATLYALLAGRPPFVGDGVMRVLAQVLTAEPPPLCDLVRDVPADLEAVVARCLEKEPGARYESARALGEDLQRFLDGDPVLARRASLVRRLVRRARRHRAAVAGVAALVVAALVVGGMFVRSRRAAAEQATLARELGETVKEMELFLRGAHGMPLHDVERERDVVRARLRDVETRMAAAGEPGRGPGHYALGRGLLGLQEPRAALHHLRAAEQAGYRAPGLDYAAGVALSELYRRGLEETRRIRDPAQREARSAALAAEFKAPAVLHLRAALAGVIEAPPYVEGLLALAEERHEEALARARAAFAAAPWLYEAKKLEGDVLYALGSRHRHDAVFDFDKMRSYFDPAAAAYAIAAEHGRSDPSVHLAECELWAQIMNASAKRGESMRPSFDRARAACERAIAAGPRSPEAHTKLAFLHGCFAFWIASGMQNQEDAKAALRDAITTAEAALHMSPGEAMTQYVVAAAYRARAYYEDMIGRDQSEALARAIVAYEAALQLDPDFYWAIKELAFVLAEHGRHASLHGGDPTEDFARAAALCDRARTIEPDAEGPRSLRLRIGYYVVDHLVRAGLSPAAEIARMYALLDEMKRQDPTWAWAPYWRVWFEHAAGLYALDAGEDAGPALARAEASARAMTPEGQVFPDTVLAMLATLQARVGLARGEDPSAALATLREVLARQIAEAPWDLGNRVQLAEAEQLAFAWSRQHGRPDGARLDAGLLALTEPLAEPRAEPRLYALVAELLHARAALRASRSEDPAADIAAGLRHADTALALHPRLDRAHAVRGELWLLLATTASDPAAREDGARRAAAALAAAIDGHPHRARTLGERLAEARRLAGASP
ncbi:serine/threonine-protein kinase [Nannocystis pusilla]|uniref:Serine/threonine protein kinase n=1 Tax=Nannocystis pusilla TaxID=889268 RepID=A0ABS7U6E6_9BACT|nr:serine/threonine-protein kinase [Nannocystis pusilla]MBZ5715831.1 serine/threonine protein kinase [Nannocystis pusilla]